MQSGKNNGRHWQIDFNLLSNGGNRWENQLIGWRGSSDPSQGIRLYFSSKEKAIAFAKRQGLKYNVVEPNFTKFKVKTYKENFVYHSEKLPFIYTK
ncbi:hypothetical protein BB560_002214 [Smittium megazygosporum]|uniref:NADH dehydrogenase [ubiquinone] iron-sulfur protein 4, mitochondrial n=1 Tax=Smittium megazygosporum TaxID=133381 RepID=A0A2T9ZFH6_9FUNG|nr:hypothetical protein BB560_002214 [Smittium megazygosporum]